MLRKVLTGLLWAGAAAIGIGALGPALILLAGFLQFERLEKSIVEKMDQYYLNVTKPGRDEYLLADDEVFQVPYMATKLTAAAEPTRIFDRTGRLIGEYLPASRLYVRSEGDLPSFLKKAVISAEDRHFYDHQGLNPRAIARAMYVNLRRGRVAQGGSTITQQLAKVMFTTRERTLGRKAFELFCARRLERKLDKDQILLLYLNFIYFGHGCYGVECASRLYFGKSAREIELAESALLAAIIASPGRYSPFRNLALAQARHRTVLKRMAANGYIPSTSVERYSREFWERMTARWVRPEDSIWRMRVNEAPYFTEYVRRQLERDFPRERLLKGGLQIHATVDLELQRAGKRALARGLQEQRSWYAAQKSSTTAKAEGGLAAVDTHSGAVLALVGGSGFRLRNQLERAAGGRRPAGSAVKPFVYATAFEKNIFTSTDTLIDKIHSYPGGRGKRWAPRNYTGRYRGEVALETALQKSLNTVAVKVLHKSDIDATIELMSKASGAPESAFPRNLTLALGTGGWTPLEAATAYALFVNGGKPIRPYVISRILDRDGNPLSGAGPAPPLAPILSTTTANEMIRILQGVMRPGGTAYRAAKRTAFAIPAFGKTGTTDDYRDAWFAGATPDIAAAVRIGHDDMRIPLGSGRSGGVVAAPVWMRFIKDAYRTRPRREFDTLETNR